MDATTASVARHLREMVEHIPAGGMITLHVDTLRKWLDEHPERPAAPGGTADERPASWRERLWEVPEQTRIGVEELAEAIGKSTSWVYKQTSRSAPGATLPFRKMGGDLVFVAGEIRAWLETEETIMVRSEAARRRLHALR